MVVMWWDSTSVGDVDGAAVGAVGAGVADRAAIGLAVGVAALGLQTVMLWALLMEQQLDSRMVLLLEATVADAVGLTVGIASVGDAVGEAVGAANGVADGTAVGLALGLQSVELLLDLLLGLLLALQMVHQLVMQLWE